MSERRTIQINPSLFEFSSKKTRQKKPKVDGGIKMKSTITKTPKNKSLKNGILKMIREKQQNDYQKLFSEKKEGANKKGSNVSTEVDNFKNEFQESIDYLKALEQKPTNAPQPPKNKTLKNYDELQNPLPTIHSYNYIGGEGTHQDVNLALPDDFNTMPPINLVQPKLYNSTYNTKPTSPFPDAIGGGNVQNPQWGCLKVGGKLPTYRSWKNATQKNRGNNTHSNENNEINAPNNNETQPIANPEAESVVNLMKESQIERIKKKSAIKQMKTLVDNLNKPIKVKHAKQRKIARRTYRIGKSKVLPKVAVLVSNRTLRNNITTKAQLLKQTPINDVKRFLIKRGFIKVGSNTPNDILRKMYESISLICGEVQNHNSENLLYNFLHGGM